MFHAISNTQWALSGVRVRTFLQGVEQVVVILYGLLVVPLDLHAVTGIEKLRVLAVLEEVLIVQLEVSQHQLVLVWLHCLELKHTRNLGYFYIQNGSFPKVLHLISAMT